MFAKGFNNASLSAIATYDDYVPAFEVVLRNCEYGIECFYSRAGAIGALAPEQRSAKMQDLLSSLVSE
jgi:predicted aminopeptidase